MVPSPPADLFVGRDVERQLVAEALEAPGLVTAVGAPGVGKTRLVLEVLRSGAAMPSDATVVVDLAGVSGDAVPVTLAVALGVEDLAGRGPVAAAADAVGRRELLLVLDGVEHVRSDCASFLGDLARACPSLRVLTATREPLELAGETLVHVDPLAVPAPDVVAPDRLMESGSVLLFCERARAAVPGFALGIENASAVAGICRRLDGIPHAIELAAARLDVLAPSQLNELLDTRFHAVLAGRSGLNRSQTIEAAVAWSYDLLSVAEQQLLRRLTVFPGGATGAAAERVCADGRLPADEVRSHLDRLVSRSLLTCRENLGDAVRRYRLLETVRRYGRERLADAGELDHLEERLADWAIELVEASEPRLVGTEQVATVRRLAIEADNLRAALAWAVRERRAEHAHRLVGPLGLWWRISGRCAEGRESTRLAAAVDGQVAPAVRARGLWAAALMELMTGNRAEADRLLEGAWRTAAVAGDQRTVARCELLAANLQQRSVKRSELPSLLERCARGAREAGDDWCLAHALALWSRACRDEHRIEEGARLLADAVAAARHAGGHQALSYCLLELGLLHLEEGRLAEAQAALQEVVSVASEAGHVYEEAVALSVLGTVALQAGRYDDAEHAARDAVERGWRSASPSAVLDALPQLARVAQVRGDLVEARARFEEAAAVAAAEGKTGSSVQLGLAQVALAQGRAHDGERLIDEATSLAAASRWMPDVVRARMMAAALARQRGDRDAAAAAFAEALDAAVAARTPAVTIDVLEGVAGLACANGHHAWAARLLGAAGGARRARGLVRFDPDLPHHHADVANLRSRLSPAELDRLWSEGESLSLDEALAIAVEGPSGRAAADQLREMLGDAVAERRPRTAGNGSLLSDLTAPERDVARLVAQGLTSRQIGDRLFISPRTVDNRLRGIFAKLGVNTRAAVAAAVARDEAREGLEA